MRRLNLLVLLVILALTLVFTPDGFATEWLLEETFETGMNGWVNQVPNAWHAADGKLIYSEAPGGYRCVRYSVPVSLASGFVIEVEIDLSGMVSSGIVGIMFGATADMSDFWAFGIYNIPEWHLCHFTPGSSLTYGYGWAPAPGPYLLKVEYDGAILNCYVNNMLFKSQSMHIPHGYVGLSVVGGGPSDRVEVEAFRVYAPRFIPEPATVYYVDVDAIGAKDGSSWADAFTDLGEAMNLGAGYPQVQEIRVAQDVYTPTEPFSSDREATFQLGNGVAMKGGYAGFGEPDPNARDIEAYETILSGDLNGDDGPDFANNDENSYHVVTGSGTNATAVLDGFTITGGNANQHAHRCGGGMYNYYGDPTLSNCTFRENSVNCHGGGMFNCGSSPIVTDCTFIGNSTRGRGGGMYNDCGRPALTNCTFSGNSAEHYGGGMYNDESSPTLMNCTFSGNSAGPNGAGGGMYNGDSSPTLANCTFSGNSAPSGGAITTTWSSLTLTNCTITGNRADTGGGILSGAGNSSTLTNCTFAANSALNGNALACEAGTPPRPSNFQLTNCILWDGGYEIWNNGNWAITDSLREGLVAYWKLDGNADDSVGGNDGTVYGAQWTIGQLGGALYFDGAGDYVDCGNDSSLNLTNNFSISAWFNLSNAGPVLLICKGNVPAYESGGAYTILCVPSNGMLGFYVRDSDNTDFGYATIAIPLNQWTHVVGTFSDGNISIYKNGAFVTTGGLGRTTIHSNNEPLGIGAEGDGGMPFNGMIDDVRIYDRVLSEPEIRQIANYITITHSDVQGGWTDEGNIDADPLFVDADGPDNIAGTADDNLRLLACSPCIDAGDNSAVPAGVTTDLDGNPRVVDGDDNGIAIVDMGAFEAPLLDPVGDLQDLAGLISSFNPGDFSNPNRQNTLVLRVNAIINGLNLNDVDSICDAINKLNNILCKTDGVTPPPDWVTGPTAQQQLEGAINDIIDTLQGLADCLGGC